MRQIGDALDQPLDDRGFSGARRRRDDEQQPAESAGPESAAASPEPRALLRRPHSTFCTCSRIFSSSAFSATTISETAGPSALEPERC